MLHFFCKTSMKRGDQSCDKRCDKDVKERLSQAFSKCTRRGCQWPRRPRQEAKEDGGAIAFKSWAFETIHVHHLLSFLIMFLPCLFREIFRVEVRKLSSWLIATHTTGVLSLVCFV